MVNTHNYKDGIYNIRLNNNVIYQLIVDVSIK